MNMKQLFLVSALFISSTVSAMQPVAHPVQARAILIAALQVAMVHLPNGPEDKMVHEFKEKEKRAHALKQQKRSGKGKHNVHQPR